MSQPQTDTTDASDIGTEQSAGGELSYDPAESDNSTRKNLDTIQSSGIPGLNVSWADVDASWTVFAPAALVSYITLRLLPPGRGWALVGLAVCVGSIGLTAALVALSPNGLGPFRWLWYTILFRRSTTERSAVAGDAGRLNEDYVSSNGDRQALEDLTRVDGYASGAGGIWRFDGSLVGGVRIDPAELSLSAERDWETAADDLGEAINALDMAGQIRSGAVVIDPGETRRRCDGRVDDEDVQANAALRHTVSMYRDRLPEQLTEQNASIRRFQFVFSVSMDEVQFEGHRILQQLSDWPLVGSLASALVSGRGMTVREVRIEQEQRLRERREDVVTELQSITGCDASPLDIDALVSVVEESWTGERVVDSTGTDGAGVGDTGRGRSHSLPVITMERQYTDAGTTPSPSSLSDSDLTDALLDELQQSQPQPNSDTESQSQSQSESEDGASSSTTTEDETETEVAAKTEPSSTQE